MSNADISVEIIRIYTYKTNIGNMYYCVNWIQLAKICDQYWNIFWKGYKSGEFLSYWSSLLCNSSSTLRITTSYTDKNITWNCTNQFLSLWIILKIDLLRRTESVSYTKNNRLILTKSAVFWGITRRCVVIVYRRFGTTHRSLPNGGGEGGAATPRHAYADFFTAHWIHSGRAKLH
jgi:hypothetical protein